MFNGIRARLVLAIVLVVTVVASIGLFLNIKHDLEHIRHTVVERNIVRLNALRIDLVNVILDYNSEHGIDLVERLGNFADVLNMSLYDNDLQVMFRYDRDPSDSLKLPDYVDVLNSSAIIFGNKTVLIHRMVSYQGKQFGWVTVRVDSSHLQDLFEEYLITAIMLLFGVAAVALVMAVLVGHYFTRPILRLAEFTRRISKTGKFEELPLRHEPGEIGDLYDGMNAMLTEIKQSEAEIERLNETRIHNIINTSLDGVISINGEGDITYWGWQNEQIFGWSEKEVLGRRIDEIIIPERYREKHLQGLKRLIDSDERQSVSRRIELSGLHRSGHEIPIEISLSATWEQDGWTFNAFVRDLSETKQAERELHEIQKRLLRNERLAAVGQLTATVAHELRNPMGTIRNSMYLLQQSMDEDSEYIGTLSERIDRNIQRCDAIITDLLDFTRDRETFILPMAINGLLGRVLAAYDCPDGVELVWDPDADATALLDEIYFESAFVNILDNAVQAAAEQHPGGGGEVVIGTVPDDDRIGIIISDNGPGISAEDAEHLFEPLYSTKVYGVGLGLPTVRKIMHKLDGELILSAAPAGGTQATLWLKAATVPVEKGVLEAI